MSCDSPTPAAAPPPAPARIDLTGRVAYVTGCGSDTGEAIAATLAQAGAAVAAVDRSPHAAARVAIGIHMAGGTAFAVQTDVADVDSVEDGLVFVRDELGPVSILVTDAAGGTEVAGAVLPDVVATGGCVVLTGEGASGLLAGLGDLGDGTADGRGVRVNGVGPGAPQDVADTVLYLSSPGAAGVAGRVLSAGGPGAA